ncbi:hypothetical protein EDB89DRAFT_2230974 [Lactarius sanguifluus]|nr:hypothetical protein EDB89DRAFT_2230974 [Lactarius sanguifluus]
MPSLTQVKPPLSLHRHVPVHQHYDKVHRNTVPLNHKAIGDLSWFLNRLGRHQSTLRLQRGLHISPERDVQRRIVPALCGLLPPADRFTRAATEDATLDSFQNVLFSVAHFRELTGAYLAHITIVGHDFKRRRFGQLH